MSGAERSVLLAIGALLLALLFREASGVETIARVGAFDVSAADIPFVLLCLAAGHCWAGKPLNLNAATIPGLILAALVCVSLARGAARDLFHGFYWLRSAGFLAPMMIIGATLRPRAETFALLRAAIVATGVALALIVLLRTLFDPALLFLVPVGDPGMINDGGRAIGNRGAVIVGMALVLTLGAVLRPSQGVAVPAVGLLALLAAGMILSQQVTAILATGAAALALFVIERPFNDRSIVGIGMALGLGLLWLTSATWLEALPAPVRATIAHRADNLGTRQAVWEGFSASYATLPGIDRLIGLPAGSDLSLTIFLSGHWRPWERALHSMYFGTLSALGLIGLCAYGALLLACVVISAFLARGGARIGSFTPAVSIAFVLLAGIEGYSYDLRQETLIVLLLPMLLVAQARWAPGGVPRRRPRAAAG